MIRPRLQAMSQREAGIFLGGLAQVGGLGLLAGQPTFVGPGVVHVRLRPMSLEQAQVALAGLVAVNRAQLRAGVPPIGPALHTRRLRYERRDPKELWLTIRGIWARGRADCEDLAAATAAELEELGIPARVRIKRVSLGLAHALTERLDNGTVLDPSITGGMNDG